MSVVGSAKETGSRLRVCSFFPPPLFFPGATEGRRRRLFPPLQSKNLSYPQPHHLERLDRDDAWGGLESQPLVGVAVLSEARRQRRRIALTMMPAAIVVVITAPSSSSAVVVVVVVPVPALPLARPVASFVIVVAVVTAVAAALRRHFFFPGRKSERREKTRARPRSNFARSTHLSVLFPSCCSWHKTSAFEAKAQPLFFLLSLSHSLSLVPLDLIRPSSSRERAASEK